MPKGRKQKPTVQKKKKSVKKKSAPKRKKLVKSKKKAAKPVLETAEEKILAEITPENQLEIENLAEVSQESANIISIVRGLEGQVETAFKLKEVLEAELDTTQQKLSEEMDARAQLEVQITSLEAQSALAEQLREDIAFVEDERNKFANQLAQVQPQLETVTDERDKLAELITSTEDHAKEIESEKIALEAQVMNLKDNITDSNRLRNELLEITEAHRSSREQARDLTRRLQNSETSKDALERELAGTHQNAKTLRGEVEELREKIAGADSLTSDLRIQLEDQQAVNRELIESNTRLENEIKISTVNCEAAKNELDSFKNALRDIRSEATRTSGRVRQRYFKPKAAGKSKKRTGTNSPRNRASKV